MSGKADIAGEQSDNNSEGDAEDRDEGSEADMNDNMDDNFEDDDWTPSVAGKEMQETNLDVNDMK